MWQWISDNWINVLLAALLVLMVALIIRGMIRRRKLGGCSCGACSGCTSCGSCPACGGKDQKPDSE